MDEASFESICIFHILDGLQDGLSHFSKPSRVACIYAVTPDSPPRIFDPQNLLRGHEPKLRDFFLLSSEWNGTPVQGKELYILEGEQTGLELTGIVSLAACSKHMHYQAWFTDEHPDLCSVGPTRRWLEYAAGLVSQSFATCDVRNLETAGFMLQHCATHAIRDYIVDERSRQGWLDTQIRVYPFLDAVLGVSSTQEEGEWPRGRVAVVEPALLKKVEFVCRFPELEQPQLGDTKHVRKLLQAVEESGRVLVSDGQRILGIAIGAMPGSYLAAQFSGTHGFLWLRSSLVCTFADGRFLASNLRANLVHLEEQLLETDMDMGDQHTLLQIISLMVNRVRDRKHGCTLIIDVGKKLLSTSGQHLESPMNLREGSQLKLACSLAKIDGALHIGRDLLLHGFACLMDGRSAPGENRARGARFNSALRFTAEHEDIIVVVVSADRPVSVIKNGIELTAACHFGQIDGLGRPPELSQWLIA